MKITNKTLSTKSLELYQADLRRHQHQHGMLTPWGFAYGKLPHLQSSLKPQYNSKNSIKQNQITMADLYLHQSIYIPIGICKREKTRPPLSIALH